MRIMMVVCLFVYLNYIMYFIFMYFSYYLECYFYFIYIELYIQYMYLWFIVFMGLVLFILLYLSFKRFVGYDKNYYLFCCICIIYISIVIMMIVEDLLVFIVCFEALFFPLFLLCIYYSFNNRFVFALYYLFVFGSVSSILCIILLCFILFHFNILNFKLFLYLCYFDNMYVFIMVWCLLIFIFSIKYPIWPLHIWLPELHVEVATDVSILLAAVILKIGFIGIFKFVFIYFNFVSIWLLGCLDGVLLVGLWFISILIFVFCDYKKIVAHWSILHTCIGLLLLWHNDVLFVGCVVFCNLGHIVSANFMFLLLGYMYDMYGVRVFLLLVSFFGVSIWSVLFTFIIIFNIDFPFMLLFYIDYMVLYGLINFSFIYFVLFFFINLLVFCSSIYIYILLNYYSFLWLDRYIRLDITYNDIHFFNIFFVMVVVIYYLLCILI